MATACKKAVFTQTSLFVGLQSCSILGIPINFSTSMRTIQFAVAFSFMVLSATAQQNDSAMFKRIADNVFYHSTAYDNLRFLCKQVGPRLSGSPQAEKSVKETYRMMKEMGADTVYLQECMVPHWVRGAKESALLVDDKGTTFSFKLSKE